MGKNSNPRLMARVLDAIKHLGEKRGSSAKQVLEILRDGSHDVPSRNLTMQVQRALKNAVTAGLLQLRSGRYKMLIPLQPAVNNRGNKTGGQNSGSKKKEDLEDAIEDSSNYQPLEAGPRSRCSHCKKHKRRGNRRRQKRSSKRRKRPTKQARERNSRKLRRRGDEEVSTRRERGKKIPNPGQRGQSEVPNGQRPERPGKNKPETNQDSENREAETRRDRDRSESSSGSEGEDDGPSTTRAKRSPSERKKRSGSRRRASGSRKSSRKRKSSENRKSSKHEVTDNMVENDVEDVTMDCNCDDQEGNQDPEIVEEDVCNVCEDRSASHTSI